MNDDQLKDVGTKFFAQAKSARSAVEERWMSSGDLYDAKFSDQERKYSEYLGVPRLFIPKTYSNIHRILVEVLDTLYFDPDEIVDVGSDKGVPLESRLTVKTLLNYRLNGHPIDSYKLFYEAGLDALKSKICIVKIVPRLKTQKVVAQYELPNLDSGQIEIATADEEKILAYDPQMVVVPPEDIFFSSFATWTDYHQWPMCHRYIRNRDQLTRLGYKNIDAVSELTDPTLGDPVKTQRLEGQSPFARQEFNKESQPIFVYEIWAHMPGAKGELESGSFIMLGDAQGPKVVGRGWQTNELPYKFSDFEYNRPPFVVGAAFPEPHVLYGKDFPEITEALQKETNAQRNQEREAVARALRPTTLLSRDSNPDLASLLNRRIGGYVQVDGPVTGAMMEMQSMNPSVITSAHQARTDTDYYETSGIPPNLLGMSTNQDTATAATQQLSNANKKIALIIKNIAYTGILPAMRYLLRLEQTYCSDEFLQQLTGKMVGWGEGGDQVPSRAAIQGDFDLKVNLGINKQAQLNKFMMLFDRMVQANQALAQMIQLGVVDPSTVAFGNTMKAFESMLPLLGIKNVEEFTLPATPPPPQQGADGAPGIASQPRLPQDPSQQVANMNPEATGVLNVL